MASPTVAANAYANLARVLDAGGSSKGNANLGRILDTGVVSKGAEGTGPSFSTVLKDALGGVMDAGRKSDAQTVALASGKANVMDVVTAVAETDVAVSTMVSVRDKVIQAYEDIMKMTI
jgi:flagellar hook-basal body complex protein FliE